MNIKSTFKFFFIASVLSIPNIGHAQSWRVIEDVSRNHQVVTPLVDSTSYTYAPSSERGSNYNNDTINFDQSYRLFDYGTTKQETRTDRVYNTNNMLVAERVSQFDAGNNAWVLQSVDSFMYTNGRVSTHKIYQRTNVSGQWQILIYKGYDYSYDANGNVILKEEKHFDGLNSPLKAKQRNYYSYNAQGLLVSDSVTRSTGSQWLFASEQELDYDANGNKVEERYYNSASGNKTLQETKYYYYNAVGQLAKDSIASSQGGQYTTHAYGYNSKGLLEVDSIRSTGPVAADYIFYDYTSFDYLKTIEYASIDPNLGSVVVIETRTFKYESYWPTDVKGAVANDNTITLYPNPATNVLHINTSEAYTQGRIYNSMGQIVQVVNANSQQVNVSELPAGNYYLQLTIDNKMMSKQFTVLR